MWGVRLNLRSTPHVVLQVVDKVRQQRSRTTLMCVKPETNSRGAEMLLVTAALIGERRMRTPAVLTNLPWEISEGGDLECRPLGAPRSSSHLESYHPEFFRWPDSAAFRRSPRLHRDPVAAVP